MKVTQPCLTLCDLMDCTVNGILQVRILEWIVFSFSMGSSQPRDWIQVSTLQADSLPAEPQGKPKNTGVGSLSLLQWIFPTWESNQGLLHCKWILNQLSYQGGPPLVFRSCSHTFLNGTKIFQLFIIRKTMHPFLNCTDYVFLDSSQILTTLEDSSAVTSWVTDGGFGSNPAARGLRDAKMWWSRHTVTSSQCFALGNPEHTLGWCQGIFGHSFIRQTVR